MSSKLPCRPFPLENLSAPSLVSPDSITSLPNFVSFNKTKLNIKINLTNKNQVGADRIVNTVAVKSLYKVPTLVIDFGTATTFDVINNSGNYVGGLITPGINLSLQNLFSKTSKLPLVKFKKINSIIGKNTKNAIQNGLYWGYIGLVTYIIKKIQTKFKKKLFCISTGGLSKIISKDINLNGGETAFSKLDVTDEKEWKKNLAKCIKKLLLNLILTQ